MLKEDILRKKADFSGIYKKGKSTGERYIVLFYIKNNLSYSRTAFLASKKVGNAVTRNRARRLMKESHRSLKDKIPGGYDMIFIARKTMLGKTLKDVQISMEKALKKGKILKPDMKKKK